MNANVISRDKHLYDEKVKKKNKEMMIVHKN